MHQENRKRENNKVEVCACITKALLFVLVSGYWFFVIWRNEIKKKKENSWISA